MARETYDECLTRVLQHEGGYVNNPADPGGPTNFGITIADYRRYVMPHASAADVKAMKLDDAKAIYRAKYWDAQRLDLFEPGVDDALFDYGVNSGIGRSGKVLRRILKLSDASSVMSDDVIAAANERHAAELAAAICDERLAFLHSLKTWPVFGEGWGRRVREVKVFAVSIAQDLPILGDGVPLVPAPGRAIDPDEHARVAALQEKLAASGFDPGAIDGDLGPKTIKAFQRSRALAVTGVEDSETKRQLEAALGAAVPA